jgi:hypothetical protein
MDRQDKSTDGILIRNLVETSRKTLSFVASIGVVISASYVVRSRRGGTMSDTEEGMSYTLTTHRVQKQCASATLSFFFFNSVPPRRD